MVAGRPAERNSWSYAVFDLATLSRLAQWAGSRSYSVYVAHLPVIQICSWAIVRNFQLSQWSGLLVVGFASIAATLIAAELLHRIIERPMMRVGADWAAHVAARANVSSRSPKSSLTSG
jgi:peptidoglycan/LPS O-acetylase OafA/YrhL